MEKNFKFMKSVSILFILGTVLSSVHSISHNFCRTNNEVSINIYHQLIKFQNGNFVFGIFPVDALLALTYLGTEGDVANQIKSAFAWNVSDDQIKLEFQEAVQELQQLPHCEIRLNNRFYIPNRLDLNPKFVEIASHFDTNIVKMDFSSAKQAVENINHWVSSRTHNKIGNFLNEKLVTAKTVAVSVNNLFFSSKWLHAFDKRETKKMDFHLSSQETVQVDMMKISGYFEVFRHPTLKIKNVKIPFENERVYMVIMLSDDIDGVDSIAKNARENWYDRNFTSEFITLYVPKFEIASTIDIIPSLKNMGITKLFSEKISGIAKEPVKISVVTQKIQINVNERGTDIDDSPIAEKQATKKHENSKEEGEIFNVNHPFVFGILYDDFSLIFGRINKI
ncbi:hypothetical protein WA026_005656 [Henosepilachna vigintioctopunctata]|uniref:Serpin domain-containing protein n=1 Tax=Henosepilachna vigintioctopunctata TaxID=420089 RepID=A0AAW1TX15_9CUCU